MAGRNQVQRASLAGRKSMRSPGRATTHGRGVQREFWRKIAEGLSSYDAATACGVSEPKGSVWFRNGGGMSPLELDEPSGRYLSLQEREDIAALRAKDCGVREIARELGRAPSTISRELRRNAATRSGKLEYRASVAQWHAEQRSQRPKVAKLVANPRLRDYVQERLSGAVTDPEGRPIPGSNVPWRGRRHGRRADRRWGTSWSPEQISHRLKIDFPQDESMRISHEAVYQALYIQGRGVKSLKVV